MVTRPAAQLAAIIGFALFAGAPPAQASDCTLPGSDFVSPAPGAHDVPANTRIFAARRAGPLRLFDITGGGRVEVPGTEAVLGARVGRLGVFTPAAPLQIGRAYMAETEEHELTYFRVGQPLARIAPPVPEVRLDEVSAEEGGDFVFARFTLNHRGAFVVVDHEGTAALQDERPVGMVSAFAFGDRFVFGRGPCLATWPDAEPGDRAELRFGAFDRAGNFSGWGEVQRLELAEEGCSCESGGGSRSPWLLGLFALVLGAGRRRR